MSNETARSMILERVSVITQSGCWEWKGFIDGEGYGRAKGGLKRYCGTTAAHRASYITHKGPIPISSVVRHTCNNRACCNPEHLILGLQYENMKDKSTPLPGLSDAALSNLISSLETKLALAKAERQNRRES